jgi:hypothetical protein
MGTTQSIDNTVLGQSLIGRKFRTRGTISFGYCGYDKKYHIQEWHDQSRLENPRPTSFELRVDIPIEFKVISMTKNWGIDSGQNIKIDIQIMNNLPLNNITSVREADTSYHWNDRCSIDGVQNPLCPKIVGSKLLTAGIMGRLPWYVFGIRFGGSYDVDQPCTIDSSLLEEIF